MALYSLVSTKNNEQVDRYSHPLADGLVLHVAAMSNKGIKRPRNEDSYLVKDGLLVIADGMGGHNAGEVASHLACQYFDDTCDGGKDLCALIKEIAEQITSDARCDASKYEMGTTVAACRFTPDNHLHYTNVGDCRLYLLRKGNTLEQLTEDHSEAWTLYKRGTLETKEDLRNYFRKNIVLNSVGYSFEIDSVSERKRSVQAGDIYLICSDGLWDMVPETDIENILRDSYAHHPDDDAHAAQALVKAANNAGGDDNITVVLARVSKPKSNFLKRTSERIYPRTDSSFEISSPEEMVSLLYRTANDAHTHKKLVTARKYLEAALVIDPVHYESRLLLVDVYLNRSKNKMPEKALELLVEIAKAHIEENSALQKKIYEISKTLRSSAEEIREERPNKSQELYGTALSGFEALPETYKRGKVLYYIGRCYEALEDTQKAAQIFTQGLSLSKEGSPLSADLEKAHRRVVRSLKAMNK